MLGEWENVAWVGTGVGECKLQGGVEKGRIQRNYQGVLVFKWRAFGGPKGLRGSEGHLHMKPY